MDEKDTWIYNAQDDLSMALQSDLENGVGWLNALASKEFARSYPELNKWIEKFMAYPEGLGR
jgi:hypothetical protein